MKTFLFILSVGLITAFTFVYADEIRNETVKFKPGTSSTSIKDSITGYESVNYKVGAKAGQQMTVEMTTDNTSNYFNIFEPGKGPGDAAMYIGSTEGNNYEGNLPTDGEYTVQVYLYRNAARRNEKANYTLNIEVTDVAG